MVEPWPVTRVDDQWTVTDDWYGEVSVWPSEQAARRYAALPVLIATIREGCDSRASRGAPPHCVFCDEGNVVGKDGRLVSYHNLDCPGIAALKAAGEAVE